MQQYLYNEPQILTDEIFIAYGGQTGTSTDLQREIAYTLAEEQMVEHLGSYLTPTIVTGTYLWRGRNPVELDYGWVMGVHSVTIASVNRNNSCQTESMDGCGALRNAKYGLLDVSVYLNCGGCGAIVGLPPYTIEVSYTSGLATGTYTSKAMLMSLTILAQINLNELDVSLSNESTADVGIEMFINQKYHEKRTKEHKTAFGDSAMARRAARLVSKYRTKPSIGFH